MEQSVTQELFEFASAVIHTRRNVLPRHLQEPGPTGAQLQLILGAGAAAPDHRQLLPWRFVIVPKEQRQRLAEVFGQALRERDPSATAQQIAQACEKAHRAPFLMLALARLQPGAAQRDGATAGETEVGDAERLVSLGCAIQNIVLAAHAAGFGTGLTSGQALRSDALRTLFALQPLEHAVCCVNIGTAVAHKSTRLRPQLSDYVSELR